MATTTNAGQSPGPNTADYGLAPIFGHADGFFRKRTLEREFDFIVPLLRRGMDVLDAGCGTGSITLGIARAVAPGQVFAIDQSQEAIEAAKSAASEAGLTNVVFEVADVLDLPIEPTSVDAVIFSGVLQYVASATRAVEQALRVLRQGGFLAARDAYVHGNWFTGPDHESIYRAVSLMVDDRHDLTVRPEIGAELKGILQRAGLERVEAAPWLAEVLCTPSFWAGVSDLMLEPEFIERAVATGRSNAEEIHKLVARVKAWGAHQDSMASTAEVKTIGWKPID